MYKNYTQKPGMPVGYIHKALLVMKLSTLILVGAILQVSAASYAQKVTINKKETTFEIVFKEMHKQTGYDFFFDRNVIKKARPVTINLKDVMLADALNACLKDQPFGYVIDSKTVVITEKPPKQASQTYIAPVSVTGVVKDSAGAALPGVTVLNRNSGKSAASTPQGFFKIDANPGDVLVFSFIGFVKQSVTVGAETKLTVIMREASNQLNAVVVTALGIKRSIKSLTYNIQQLKASEVTTVPDASFVNALAGKVAGATINASSSGIGGSVRVVLRGEKSVFGNNNALYVLDGIPLPNLLSANSTYDNTGKYYGRQQSGDGITDLNGEDIESISVLTGASSAALYGSLAANGVILVNTKSGSKNKTNINFVNSTSFYNPLLLPKFQDTYGATAPGNFDSWSTTKLGIPSTYNPADYFQTGTNVTNSISVATGTDRSQTYFSAAADNARGIIPNNTFNRYNLTLHQSNQWLDDKLKLDLTLMYVKDQNQNAIAQGIYGNPISSLYLFPRSDNIEKYQAYERYDVIRNFNLQYWPQNYQFGQNYLENPFWQENREIYLDQRERYILGAGLTYQALSWLDLEARVRVDNNNEKSSNKLYASTYTVFTAGSANGYYGIGNSNTRQTYADFIAKTHNILSKYFSLNGILGATLTNTSADTTGTKGGIASVPNLFTLANIVNPTLNQGGYYDQSQAIFGSAELNYKSQVYLTVTGRNEWASQLANASKQSFFYPSVGLAAIVSDMVKLPANIISYLKVRGSYSEVGNTLPRFVTSLYYPVTQAGFSLNPNLPLTTLQPERTHSLEVGINSRFINDIINFDVTLYNTNTFNQFFTFKAPSSSGIANYYVNAGQVNNKGIEAALGGNVKLGPVRWTPTVIFSLNRNNVVSVVKNQKNPLDGSAININEYPTGSPDPVIKVGKPIGELYVTGVATDPKGYFIVDESGGTGPNAKLVLDPNTYIDAGNTNPRYNMSFRNGISYKNFNLSFLIDYRNGGVVQSVTQSELDYLGVSAASAQARDRGYVTVNGAPFDPHAYYTGIGDGKAMSFYVYSATNARLREASISYTIPGASLKNVFKNITLSVIGRNLFMFYNKAPFDPELTASTGTYYQGVDNFMLPSLRSFGFSVRVGL